MNNGFFLTYWRLAHVVDLKIPQNVRRQLREDVWTSYGELLLEDLRTALAAWQELSLGRHAVQAILLRRSVAEGRLSRADILNRYDEKTAMLIDDLNHVYSLRTDYAKGESETFSRLMVAVAKDVRVIMMLIARRLVVMRSLGSQSDENLRRNIAAESLQLYAPLAHRMGLYAVKTELEDLGLKYTEYDTYKDIAHKLNAKKRERDAYIHKFIEPVRQKLEAQGLKFEIKGRTKSIYSIWRKMQKQGCDVDGVYDLFAIRIVIDADNCPVQGQNSCYREQSPSQCQSQGQSQRAKSLCWQVYALVADMYVPNTKRLRDWITVPKSNGYESLHTTVMGPEGKWVEVQIRTKDMDEVAEKGVAAHWKYKGIKSDGAQSEEWLRQLREVLEQGGADSDSNEAQQHFKMELYDDDVFVFTPQGELRQMPRGSTVLDFAFSIHSRIGETAVGAKVNGRHVQIGYKLANGDQIEIVTSANQKPKADWLNIVVTARARQRIRQKLQEIEFREAELGREIVERKFRNWKIDIDDSMLTRAAGKFGYENLRQFFVDVNNAKVDLLDVREWILCQDQKEECPVPVTKISANQFAPQCISPLGAIVIDGGVQGLDYELSRCCNPVYGDEIFGFVGAHGGIKIHRKDCPNAHDLMDRMHDRMVQVHWATDNVCQTDYIVNLRIVGNDDLGILNNITSIISKESNINMRNLSVNSEDGLFECNVSLVVRNVRQVDLLLRKIRTVKGVKQAVRV